MVFIKNGKHSFRQLHWVQQELDHTQSIRKAYQGLFASSQGEHYQGIHSCTGVSVRNYLVPITMKKNWTASPMASLAFDEVEMIPKWDVIKVLERRTWVEAKNKFGMVGY